MDMFAWVTVGKGLVMVVTGNNSKANFRYKSFTSSWRVRFYLISRWKTWKYYILWMSGLSTLVRLRWTTDTVLVRFIFKVCTSHLSFHFRFLCIIFDLFQYFRYTFFWIIISIASQIFYPRVQDAYSYSTVDVPIFVHLYSSYRWKLNKSSTRDMTILDGRDTPCELSIPQ